MPPLVSNAANNSVASPEPAAELASAVEEPKAVSKAAATTRSRATARAAPQRVVDEPAFVLHRHPWKESSLILDVFTRHHGRVAVVAKGAKRPHSLLRSTLVNFQLLGLTYTGKSEVKTLSRAEWLGGMAPLTGTPLMAAFYFNELLIKLLAREDAHAELFDAYAQALRTLQIGGALDLSLRSFEWQLLTALGLMPALDTLRHGNEPVQGARHYEMTAEGLVPASQYAQTPLPGERLLALARRDWAVPGVLPLAKRLLRGLLAYHLGGAPLRTRQLLIDLHNL